MFKGIVFITCVGMLFFGTAGLGYSQQEEKDVNTQVTGQLGDVGNKICPVSGEKIEEEIKSTYEYAGKVYNFCCVSCLDELENALAHNLILI